MDLSVYACLCPMLPYTAARMTAKQAAVGGREKVGEVDPLVSGRNFQGRELIQAVRLDAWPDSSTPNQLSE